MTFSYCLGSEGVLVAGGFVAFLANKIGVY